MASSRASSGSELAFPVRLYNATIDPKISSIQWDEAGKTIIISDERECAKHVLGSRLLAEGASALRQQLQKHGFMRMSNTPVKLRHPCFIRYKRSLLKSIQPLVPDESEALGDIREDVEEVKDTLADVRQCIKALVVAMHHAGINVRPTGVHESVLSEKAPPIPPSLGVGDLCTAPMEIATGPATGEISEGEWSDGSWESASDGGGSDCDSFMGGDCESKSFNPDMWLNLEQDSVSGQSAEQHEEASTVASTPPPPPLLTRRSSSFDALCGSVAPISSLSCAYDELKSAPSSPRSIHAAQPLLTAC